MVMALGRSMARFESADPRLHNWTVASPNFLPFGANNGHGTCKPLPFSPHPDHAPPAPRLPRGRVETPLPPRAFPAPLPTTAAAINACGETATAVACLHAV